MDFDTNLFSTTDGQSSDNPNKALRDWAESVQKKNKDLEQAIAEMQGALKQSKVSSTFESLGVPALAGVYQGDADPEAIKSWVTNVKSAFGIADQTPDLPVVPTPAPALTPDALAAYQQLNAAGGDGRASTGLEDKMREIGQAGSVQDMIKTFQTLR